MSISIRQRYFLLCFVFFLSVSTAFATEYTIRPSLSDQSGSSIAGEDVHEIEVKPIPYWVFLLMLGFAQMTSAPETFFTIKFLPILGGHRKICRSNVLENTKRDRLYAFIKSRPGSYFSEIIKATGLNRGTVDYHLRMMKAEDMIEFRKINGKKRYFLNHSTYNEEEQTVIAELKNDVHRRIILEILNNQSMNHKTLAEKIGVSAPTITHHIKHLKKTGIVKAETKGWYTTYSIDSNYFDSLQKYSRIPHNVG